MSELGHQQAAQAATRLSTVVPEDLQLISSPLARALETAEPLAQALGKAITRNDAYREIPAPVPLAERQTWLRQFMQERWQTQEPSLQQWRERLYTQLLDLKHPTVVFTHFLVINAVVGQVQGREETLCFWPDNASVTQLSLNEGVLELVALGEELSTVVN